MKKTQYLLLKMMEECAEISHICSKQIQFGKDSTNRGKYDETNSDALLREIIDFMVIGYLLEDAGEIRPFGKSELKEALKAKVEKMQKYLDYSEQLGELPRIQL